MSELPSTPVSRGERFVTSDGYEHHVRRWIPPDDRPRGFIVALHGIQSHSGWYEWSSGKLCAAGFEVLFADRRGSGLNECDRGHARHHTRLINDVVQLLDQTRRRRNEQAPTAPVVLLGLSWGGKLATAVAARRPELIDGLVLLYPGLKSRFQAGLWDSFRLSLAGAAEKFDHRVPVPLDDPALFTAQPDAQQFIRDDPLALRDVTVSFLLANRELDRLVDELPRGIRCPTLLLLAGADRIIDNAAVRAWFESLAVQDRTLIEYPGASHTLEFDPCREQFVTDLLSWLERLRKTT